MVRKPQRCPLFHHCHGKVHRADPSLESWCPLYRQRHLREVVLSFPAPTLLLVSANKPYSIMAAPCGVGGVSVPLCMTVPIDVSIIKFKIKSSQGLVKLLTMNSNFKSGEQWLAVGVSVPSPCPQGCKVSIIEMFLITLLPLVVPAQPPVPMSCQEDFCRVALRTPFSLKSADASQSSPSGTHHLLLGPSSGLTTPSLHSLPVSLKGLCPSTHPISLEVGVLETGPQSFWAQPLSRFMVCQPAAPAWPSFLQPKL